MDTLITYFLNISLIILTVISILGVYITVKNKSVEINTADQYKYFKFISKELVTYKPIFKYLLTVVSILLSSSLQFYIFFLLYTFFPDMWIRQYYIIGLGIVMLIDLLSELLSYLYVTYAVIHNYEFNYVRQQILKFSNIKLIVYYLNIYAYAFGSCVSCIVLFN